MEIDIRQTDDDGVEHFVWIQEREDTCGPACVLMMERIVRQRCTQGGEDRLREIARCFPKGYTDGNGVASYNALEGVLKLIGIPVIARKVPNIFEPVKASNFPFIARIGWAGGGGHYIVCSGITASKRLVCLDPYHGLVQPGVDTLPQYSATINARAKVSRIRPIQGSFSGHIIEINAST